MNFDAIAEQAADEIWHDRKSLEWVNARSVIKEAIHKTIGALLSEIDQLLYAAKAKEKP